MRCVVQYEGRLGDIIMSFPACRYLAQLGHEVFFYSHPQYRTIFDLISYARWTESPQIGSSELRYDLQIFPTRWHRFRESRKRWREFVYAIYPELEPAMHQPIVFDRSVPNSDLCQYGLPGDYVLISPYGHSQLQRPSVEWFLGTVEHTLGNCRNTFMLSEGPVKDAPLPVITASKLSHLAPLIANAREFFTINSAPSIIASVVRAKYYHVYQPDYHGQDNFEAPSQVVIHAW